MNYIPDTTETTVRMGTIEVQGLSIFYREAGKSSDPKLVLLGGFPASSHQFRNLIPEICRLEFHALRPLRPAPAPEVDIRPLM